MTETGREISKEYNAFYEELDTCLMKSDASCLERIFKKFQNLSKKILHQKSIKSQKVRDAYDEFMKNMTKAEKNAVDSIKATGQLNLKQFSEKHKQINKKLYDTLKTANVSKI